MGVSAQIDRITFAGGELGETLRKRADLAKYQIAVEACENFVVLPEGALTRRPGTRFVLELKDQTQKGRLLPFRLSSSDYYMQVVNAGKTRLVRQGGFIQNPDTTPYEFTVPWAEVDLPSIQTAQTGNVIYAVSTAVKPQEITRFAHTNWTCADFAPTGGPVATQNLDVAKTVKASAVSGNGITLTGVGGPLTADMQGGIMRLDEPDLSAVSEWTINETGLAAGNQRRWNGNVYEVASGTDAGVNAPVHTEGSASAGNGKVTWRWLHAGYGIVKINNVNSGAGTASADVLSQLPNSVVSAGTFRWSGPAWTSALGWPNVIAFYSTRLAFFRGDTSWMSAVDDPHDFDPGQALDDDAISFRLRAPDASLVTIQWARPSGVLILGTADNEWSVLGADVLSVLTPKTVNPVPETSDGSQAQVPTVMDGGIMYVGKTGRRLHYGKYDRQQRLLIGQELSVTARHIFAVGVAATAWQRDPNRVLWMAMQDGSLASLTFMPEQQISAYARHPMVNAFIEDIASIPSVSSGSDEVYMIVRRTINGVTKRYVEQLADFFAPVNPKAPTADGAWFLDCALQFANLNAASLTQLIHLEGQEVAVFADGAMQSRKIVQNGTITLDRKSMNGVVGLPVRGYIKDLARNVTGQSGTTTEKLKTVHEPIVAVHQTGGAEVCVNGGPWEDLIQTGTKNYTGSLPLLTCTFRPQVEGEWDGEAQLELQCDNALPATVLAMSPVIDIEET